jgi:hypothetical protein
MPRPPSNRPAGWGKPEGFEAISRPSVRLSGRTRESLDDIADNQSSGSDSTSTLGSTTSLDAERKEGSKFEWEFPASTRVDAYKYVPSDPDAYDSGTGNICVKFIKKGNRRKEYVYTNVPYHTYMNFHSPGTSKGKFINSTLNAIGYHEATDDDLKDYF